MQSEVPSPLDELGTVTDGVLLYAEQLHLKFQRGVGRNLAVSLAAIRLQSVNEPTSLLIQD